MCAADLTHLYESLHLRVTGERGKKKIRKKEWKPHLFRFTRLCRFEIRDSSCLIPPALQGSGAHTVSDTPLCNLSMVPIHSDREGRCSPPAPTAGESDSQSLAKSHLAGEMVSWLLWTAGGGENWGREEGGCEMQQLCYTVKRRMYGDLHRNRSAFP